MIISHHLPEPNGSKAETSDLDLPTMIIDAKVYNSYFCPEHTSPRGMLCTFNGIANYLINNRHYCIRDNYFFILNQNSSIEIDIPSQKEVNPFFILFDSNIVKDIHEAFSTPLPELLENVPNYNFKSGEFVERLHHFNNEITDLVFEIKKYGERENLVEEKIYELYAKLLQINSANYLEICNLNVVKKTTREELYHRLYNAKYFIDENYDRNLSLADIAEYAALNSFHLLRLFRQLFQLTPHQYVMATRLKRAEDLLMNSNKPIDEIVLSVGLESASSFSLLFKRKYGCSPKAFRKEYKK
jgi:AraC-like DNA-binding protein